MTLHGREVYDWRGKLVRLNRTTLYKQVRAYLEFGVAGLLRKKREDAGMAKVNVRRKWDNAVPFDADTKAAIANALLLHIRGLWKSGQLRSKVKFLAELFLRQQTEQLGYLPNDPGVFVLTVARINQERQYAKVGRHSIDRKASENSRWTTSTRSQTSGSWNAIRARADPSLNTVAGSVCTS